MNFADSQNRVNAAVLKHLPNCTATLNGTPITGVFDNQYAQFDMVSGSQPAITLSAEVSVTDGDSVVINSISYTVAYQRKNGAGLNVLILEKV